MTIQFPSWMSWYKKPEYRDFREYATNVSSGKRPLSSDGRDAGIPSRLRLERILANKTCSPMSLYDFYMYLKYIEYSAENLEFYIWFKNYETAYLQGLAGIDNKDYGSIPSAAVSTSSVAPIKPEGRLVCNEKEVDEDDDEDTEAAKEALARISDLITTTALCTTSAPPPCAFPEPAFFQPPNPATPTATTTTPLSTTKQPPKPPSSTEITDIATITTLFLLPSSPKELNIPQTLRTTALAALSDAAAANTPPHPSTLQPIADHIYSLLRNCSHRNFVRLGVGNGTFETVCVATVLGWVVLLAGFAVVLCRGLGAPQRGWNTRWEVVGAWPLWGAGMALVLSGLRGSCFFLLLFSRRQRLPWERFDDGGRGRRGSVKVEGRKGMRENMRVDEAGRGFGLVVGTVRRLMVFDRKLRVQDRYLRRLQRKIVLQSLAGGGVFATLCVVVFLFLPLWKETV